MSVKLDIPTQIFTMQILQSMTYDVAMTVISFLRYKIILAVCIFPSLFQLLRAGRRIKWNILEHKFIFLFIILYLTACMST